MPVIIRVIGKHQLYIHTLDLIHSYFCQDKTKLGRCWMCYILKQFDVWETWELGYIKVDERSSSSILRKWFLSPRNLSLGSSMVRASNCVTFSWSVLVDIQAYDRISTSKLSITSECFIKCANRRWEPSENCLNTKQKNEISCISRSS